jgi:hypothetical protein
MATLSAIAHGTSVPTHASLQLAQLELNSNATSVHSTGGDGLFGHLVLTMQPARYAALTNAVPFVVPVHPGADPVHAAGATGPQITETNRIYLAAVNTFRTYHSVDRALRKQLLEACPHRFLRVLEDRELGFGNVTMQTTLAMLTHLWATYGTITADALDANMTKLNQAWHPPTPIETLFDQMDSASDFAIAGGAAIGEPNIVRAGYNLIFATGLFDLPCREWRAKPDADKTRVVFHQHFLAANQDRTLTTSAAGFHSANAAVTTVSTAPPASANAATSSDATLQQIAALTASVAKLTAQLNTRRRAPGPPPANTPTETTGTGYCWTHGTSRNVSHTSATCKKKAPGHRDDATTTHRHGGSDKIWTAPIAST